MPATPALDGGTPAVSAGAVKSWPIIDQKDRDAVLSVLDSDPLQLHTLSAPKAVELMAKWAEYIGTAHSVACYGGTGALQIGLFAAGVRPGDEVIVPAFTYWSSAAAVLHQNGVPVFADVDPQTATMDPAALEERITDHTRAIMPVHIHGMPADLDPILAIARKHGLLVVGDCCQAHGAAYKGAKVGSIEDIGCFSLNRWKNVTGGEGGIINTDNDELYERAMRMGHFGEVPGTADMDGGPLFGLGWNFRPLEFINALALSQLERLDERNAIRRGFADYLTAELERIPGFGGQYVPEYADPCYFSYVVEFRPHELGLETPAAEFRGAMTAALQAEGVPLGQMAGVPIPAMEVFEKQVGYGRGCPWTCAHGSGMVKYDQDEYPQAQAFIASHGNLGGVFPPNDMTLMQQYIAAFQKVSENVSRVMELAGA